jgi:glycosyltransferase involved in cell wall biosynthesis
VLARLGGDAALRQRLGGSARERVVESYSWQRHCEQLERVLGRIAA